MSYFKAKIGQRPSRPPTAEPKQPRQPPQATPHFSRPLGARGTPPQPEPSLSTCPLCCSPLATKAGLYDCQGRCETRWLENESGQLVDLATLPFGACGCCQPPQALIAGDQGPLCPSSGQAYLLTARGPLPLAEAAPEGVCHCCQPPLPLVRQAEALVCQAKPYHQYERRGEQLRLLSPTTSVTTAEETLSAIDHALRRNTAQLTIHGLFDVE